MSTDLIAELRAALDADETTALAATQGDWVWSREFVTPPGYHHRTIGPLEPGDAAYIARFDPAFALADIAAKRRILDLAEQLPILTAATDLFDNNRDAWAEVIRTLAEAYGIHGERRTA